MQHDGYTTAPISTLCFHSAARKLLLIFRRAEGRRLSWPEHTACLAQNNDRKGKINYDINLTDLITNWNNDSHIKYILFTFHCTALQGSSRCDVITTPVKQARREPPTAEPGKPLSRGPITTHRRRKGESVGAVGHVSPQKKIGKILFGQLSCKIRAFSANIMYFF